jgi:hypothetical protein
MKMYRKIFITVMMCAGIALHLMPLYPRGYEIKRFAMIVGANYGGPSRVRLRYAVSDARSVLSVLNRMGGVSRNDSMLLIEPNRKRFIASLKDLRRKLKAARSRYRRLEVVFYYSGHSDEDGILLGGEKVLYREIRRSIENMSADVRIAILDSCSSGAFTRLKGGRVHSPFLFDSSFNMKGYAFMTSSSFDEASQESDRIKGSFFTHYLVSGLRGAADMTLDGRITLNEAYQFAYKETLGRTQRTVSGPQHPNYNIKMTGTGDVIMTEIRKSSAVLLIPENISGRIFIRDSNNVLIAELRKSPGRFIQLGLEDGTYTIINELEGKLYEARVQLRRKKRFLLSFNNFELAAREYAVLRGDEKRDLSNYTVVPLSVSLIPIIQSGGKTIHNYSFNLLGSYSNRLEGLSLGIGPGIVSEEVEGLQINVLGNYGGSTMSFLQLSALFNIALGQVNGSQITALFNYAGDTVDGLQLSAVFNYAEDDFEGVQITALFNYTGGYVDGLQASALFNYTGEYVEGVQVATIFNYTDRYVSGLQGSVLFNYTGEYVEGVQVSSLFNYAGEAVTGSQVSVLFNHAGGDVTGFQGSVLFNNAQNVQGVQMSVVNYAEAFDITQIGILNIAGESKGLQLGIVNIATKQEGLPLGLVNIAGNGGIDLVAWGSNLMAVNAGVMFRTQYFYTMISVGGENLAEEEAGRSHSTGFHLGARLPVSVFFFDMDLGYVQIDNGEAYSSAGYTDQGALQARLMVKYNITGWFGLFAGGGVSYLYDYEGRFRDGDYLPLFCAGISFTVYGI